MTHPALSKNDEFADFETWAGSKFTPADLQRADGVEHDYAKGAPMGGELKPGSPQVDAGDTAKGAPTAIQNRAYTSPVWVSSAR